MQNNNFNIINININVIAYYRMSTDKQEYSIDSQKRIVEEYATNNKFNIIKSYEDKGISGRDASKRPAFMQMIDDSYNNNNNIKYLLIYDSSRFARNLEQSLVYKSILKKNNIEIISVTEPRINDDSQLITDALIGAMNEMYSLKLSKVVKRGMQEKALKGEYISQAPFGYIKPKGKNLEIKKDEALIVQKIYEDFLNNKSSYSIAKELNKLNIKTKRGNRLDTRFINKILSNPTYKGYYKFTSENKTIITKSTHKPIIKEEMYDKVQEKINNKINNNIFNNNKINNKHWLCGLIRCSQCNNVYVYAKYPKNKQDRFRCGGYTTGKCNNGYSIGINDLEEIILEQIKNIFPNYFDKNYEVIDIDIIKANYNNTNINNNTKSTIIKQIKQHKKSLLKIKQAYLMEIDTIEEYKQNKKEINKNIKHLENILEDILEDANNISSNTNNINIINHLLNNTANITNSNNYLAKLIINKILIINNTSTNSNSSTNSNNIIIQIYFNLY